MSQTWEFQSTFDHEKDLEAIKGIVARGLAAKSLEQKDMALWEAERFIVMLSAKVGGNFDLIETHYRELRRIMGICAKMLPHTVLGEAVETKLLSSNQGAKTDE